MTAVSLAGNRPAAASPVALHAVSQGHGVPVVLSHALGLDLSSWDALADALSPDYTVIRHDHRGHGASPAPPGPYSMEDLVEDAASLLQRRRCAPVVWVGLSMGAMVGLGLAIRYPELLRGLVVAHSCAYYPDAARAAWDQRIATVRTHGIGAVADTVMGRYFHAAYRAQRPDVEAWARSRLLSTSLDGYLGCCQAVRNVDWREGLARIRCPVRVIAGALDQGTPVAYAEAMTQAIPGAQLEILHHASHIGALEQPEAFATLVRDFLATVADPSRGPSL